MLGLAGLSTSRKRRHEESDKEPLSVLRISVSVSVSVSASPLFSLKYRLLNMLSVGMFGLTEQAADLLER